MEVAEVMKIRLPKNSRDPPGREGSPVSKIGERSEMP